VWRFALALVAKKSGKGAVVARVRAIACTDRRGAETCRPITLEAKGDVRVGS